MKPRLEEAFSSAVATKKVPGIAAVALDRNGEKLFKGAYGTTNASDSSNAAKMTADTPVIIWSCTKIFTTVAALQLVEQGKLALDDHVEKYVPSIANIQVLEGFDSDDKPILRPAKTKATILQLMTHTAGFSYWFFDAVTAKYTEMTGTRATTFGERKSFDTPLLFDPGTKYTYGVNTDWLGFVVEAVTGMRLEQYIDKNICQPLGLSNTGAQPRSGSTRLVMHHRGQDRSLTANPALMFPSEPEVCGGGYYLFSTLNDLSSFLLTILNGGEHPTSGVRVLSEQGVKEYLFEDQIHKICSNRGIGRIDACGPELSSNGELLPGIEKGWSCGFMLNPQGSPKGRSAKSASWAGLGNLYYWLDPQEGKLGLTMSAVLPFMDPEVCHLHDELERAVYGHESAQELGEFGGNFAVPKM